MSKCGGDAFQRSSVDGVDAPETGRAWGMLPPLRLAMCVLILLSAAATAQQRATTPPGPAKPDASDLPASEAEAASPRGRVAIPPDQWPWSAIGRINIAKTTQRSFCTGTLVGPRTVVTAAHCLIDARLNEWIKPEFVHFVAGLAPGPKFTAHSVVARYVTSPAFGAWREGPLPDYRHGQEGSRSMNAEMIKNDWAVLTLQDALDLKTIPVDAVSDADLATTKGSEIVVPGYGAERPYILAAARGCSVKTDVRQLGRGSLVHTCDTSPGGSGSPVLVLENGGAKLIGIATAGMLGQPKTMHGGFGVSATQFLRDVAAENR